MEIKIKKMKIENFKRIKKFELDFPSDLKVYGDNGTGKTTLLDAFTWCLFEKDSLGATKFAWKPLNKDRSEKHNLDTSVEVYLSIDGTEHSYKRLVREIYTKKRGEAEATFTGHETICSIDGIDKNVGDFKKAINDIIKEDLFRMLTSVTYFTSLNWDKQREIIFSLVTNVSDKEIAVEKPEFEKLLDYLNKGITVAEVLKQSKLDKQNLNLQANTLSTRISTLGNSTFNLPENYNNQDTEMELKRCYARQREIAATPKDSKKVDLQETIYEIESKIRQLNADKQTLINKAKSDHELKVAEVASKTRRSAQELSRLEDERDSLSLRIHRAENQIAEQKAKKETLYAKYDEINEKQFTEGNCAYCGQPLPVSKLNEARDKFNLNKAKELESIVLDGKNVNQLVTQTEQAVEGLKKQLMEVLNSHRKCTEELFTYQTNMKELTDTVPTVDTANIDAEIETQQDRLKTVKNVAYKQSAEEDPFKDELNHLETEIKRLNDLLAEARQRDQSNSRIEEFKRDLQQVNIASAANETLQILCEKFLAYKASYLETKINGYFDIVKFQLFQTQINGGIVETCVATVDGVPFPSVNSAARINAGLDIIKTLQMIYGIKAPIWIDNAESVTSILTIPCQMIKLFVTEDETMRFASEFDYSDIIVPKETVGEEKRV